MSAQDWNKLLWFLCIICVNGLISLGTSQIKSKKVLRALLCIYAIVLFIVSVCWAFFDFWVV